MTIPQSRGPLRDQDDPLNATKMLLRCETAIVSFAESVIMPKLIRHEVHDEFLRPLISGECLKPLNEIHKYLSPETRLSSTLRWK